MRTLTLSVIATIILGGIGFLFLGTVLTRILEQIEIPNIVIFGGIFISFAIAFAVHAQRLTKKQIQDANATI
ncbi:MAG TPA: hypothetical protein VD689_04070 [Nitrosopumilaceae archaeon]|nr:hypothetical protein [Nitrosopumilaceae archaeon]